MKISKRQLRRIIQESMKDDYRQMGNFDPDSREMHAAPEGVPLAAYVDAHYEDFIDAWIRQSSMGSDRFLDYWEDRCEDEGWSCNQEELQALVDRAVDEGEVEDGDFFIGTRGA
tara:strand:- start:619 stop:960 length:342 start_codon:yes stop_codon:yes gene_type:complete